MVIGKRLERWSPLIVLAIVLLLWQAIVTLFRVPEFIFPSPWQIAQEFVAFRGALVEAAWKTFWVTMLGFGLSIAVGDRVRAMLRVSCPRDVRVFLEELAVAGAPPP